MERDGRVGVSAHSLSSENAEEIGRIGFLQVPSLCQMFGK
jgi:hypothetical protein